MSKNTEPQLDFWGHLDILRGCLLRILVAASLCSIVAFVFKDQLFEIVLAPKSSDFISYKLFELVSMPVEKFDASLINTGLSRQFVIHMKVAFYAGLIIVSPYVLYVLFGFVAPALYDNEKRHVRKAVMGGYVMFLVGLAAGYFLVFPLTFRFLSNYSISGDVANLISIDSYVDSLVLLCLAMGLFFELPILCVLLAKMGMLDACSMRGKRKYAVVFILVAAAIITPTSDVFTLMVVALPVYLLYELSILLVSKIG